MLGMAPDYDHLTVIQKVEVFEHAMDSTSGELGWVMAGLAGCRCGWLGSIGCVGGRDAGSWVAAVVLAQLTVGLVWALRSVQTAAHGTAHCRPYPLPPSPGEDLHKVLWLKSRNSEVWLERRTNYTRSTAVMSMVRCVQPVCGVQQWLTGICCIEHGKAF